MKTIEVTSRCTGCGRSITWLCEVESDSFLCSPSSCEDTLADLSRWCPALPSSVNSVIRVNGISVRGLTAKQVAERLRV